MEARAIIDRAAARWSRSSALTRLIVINAAVFAVLFVSFSVMMMLDKGAQVARVLNLLEMPANLRLLLTRPWTPLTYMFTQCELLHVLFNMLWLYWFGAVLMQRCSSRQLVLLYLMGGLGGAAAFILASYLAAWATLGVATGRLIGSSASVLAVVAATAILAPRYRFRIPLVGTVSLRLVAVTTIILDVVGVTGDVLSCMAHLGGVCVGLGCGLGMWRHPSTLNFRLSWPRRWRPRRNSLQRPPQASEEDQELLDLILDKIKRSGYTSLTVAERKRLFDVSKRIH